MSTLLYRRLRLLILTLCLILAWGFSAYLSLPRMEDPAVSQRMALVRTVLPGATAERTEALVSQPLEQGLRQIPEINRIAVTTTEGHSLIWLELNSELTAMEEVWSQVRSKLLDLSPQLPPVASEPQYEPLEPRAYTLIAALTWELDTPPNYAILTRQVKALATKLRSLPGTEGVDIVGSSPEEILVEIHPVDLNALGLGAQELAQQIQRSDAKVSADRFYGQQNRLPVTVATALDSLERIRNIPVCGSAYQSGSGVAQGLRLGDVAQVSKGIRQPQVEAALIADHPAVVFSVRMEATQQIDRWSEELRQKLAAFQASLPTGLGLEIIFDQSHYIKRSTRLRPTANPRASNPA